MEHALQTGRALGLVVLELVEGADGLLESRACSICLLYTSDAADE